MQIRRKNKKINYKYKDTGACNAIKAGDKRGGKFCESGNWGQKSRNWGNTVNLCDKQWPTTYDCDGSKCVKTIII